MQNWSPVVQTRMESTKGLYFLSQFKRRKRIIELKGGKKSERESASDSRGPYEYVEKLLDVYEVVRWIIHPLLLAWHFKWTYKIMVGPKNVTPPMLGV